MLCWLACRCLAWHNSYRASMSILSSGLLPAVSYGLASSLMTFANKFLFYSKDLSFPLPSVIILIQMAFTIIAMHIARDCFQLIKFSSYTLQSGKQLLFPSLMYCTNVTCGLAALSGLSIPVYQLLKRMTAAVTLLLAYLVLGRKPSRQLLTAIGLITIGTVLMGFGDLSSKRSGYVLGAGSVISQALYLTYVERSGCAKGFDTLSVLYLNSVNCLPLMFLVALFLGELDQLVYMSNE